VLSTIVLDSKSGSSSRLPSMISCEVAQTSAPPTSTLGVDIWKPGTVKPSMASVLEAARHEVGTRMIKQGGV
jgi:hypothetical protein